MYEVGSATASQGRKSAGTVGKWPESLPVCLGFVMSSSKTAQRMTRFPDDKARFVFPFYGIILSIFGIRGGQILLIVGGQIRPRWIPIPAHHIPTGFPGHHDHLPGVPPQNHRFTPGVAGDEVGTSAPVPGPDVLRFPAEEYLARLRPEGEAVVEDMVHERYAALVIERAKFDRINRCPRWAVASFNAWVPLTVLTITL